MVTLLPIEPISEAHGGLIVEVFNKLFINKGGQADGYGGYGGDGNGYGSGHGDGSGDGYGNGNGDGHGDGYGDGYGNGSGNGEPAPEAWQAD